MEKNAHVYIVHSAGSLLCGDVILQHLMTSFLQHLMTSFFMYLNDLHILSWILKYEKNIKE